MPFRCIGGLKPEPGQAEAAASLSTEMPGQVPARSSKWSKQRLFLATHEAANSSGLHRLQAIRSVIRIIATALLALDACSLVFLLQVQTKFFLAVNGFPS